MSTLDELELGRVQICEQMGEIDRMLARMVRTSPGRNDLIEQKNLLLRQLHEQKMRIAEERRSYRRSSACRVSDHALVRWLQRRHGIDVGRLKAMILTDDIKMAMFDGKEFWADEHVVYAIKAGTVVTVLPLAALERKIHAVQTGNPESVLVESD